MLQGHGMLESMQKHNPSLLTHKPSVLQSVPEKSPVLEREVAISRTSDLVEDVNLMWDAIAQELGRAAEQLRGDVDRAEGRMAKLMVAERNQWLAAMEEMRRSLERQQERQADALREQLAELLSEGHGQRMAQLGLPTEARVGGDEVLSRLRCDLDTSQTQQATEGAYYRAQLEHQKAQLSVVEVALLELSSELSAIKRDQGHQLSQAEAMLRDMRTDVDSLRDNVQAQAKASEEIHVVHQAIMQSASDITLVMQEVSQAVAKSEEKMRGEMQATCNGLQAADERHCADILGAFDKSSQHLAQGLVDEREQRAKDFLAMRQDVKALSSQVSDNMAACERAINLLREQMVEAGANDFHNLCAEVALQQEHLEQLNTELRSGAATKALPEGDVLQEHSLQSMVPLGKRIEVLEAELGRLALRSDVQRLEVEAVQTKKSLEPLLERGDAEGSETRKLPHEAMLALNARISVVEKDEAAEPTQLFPVKRLSQCLMGENTPQSESALQCSLRRLVSKMNEVLVKPGETDPTKTWSMAWQAVDELRAENLSLHQENEELAQDMFVGSDAGSSKLEAELPAILRSPPPKGSSSKDRSASWQPNTPQVAIRESRPLQPSLPPRVTVPKASQSAAAFPSAAALAGGLRATSPAPGTLPSSLPAAPATSAAAPAAASAAACGASPLLRRLVSSNPAGAPATSSQGSVVFRPGSVPSTLVFTPVRTPIISVNQMASAPMPGPVMPMADGAAEVRRTEKL